MRAGAEGAGHNPRTGRLLMLTRAVAPTEQRRRRRPEPGGERVANGAGGKTAAVEAAAVEAGALNPKP